MPALPNAVLLFVGDDIGIGDVSSSGFNTTLVQTPNIDALAAQGARFTSTGRSPGRDSVSFSDARFASSDSEPQQRFCSNSETWRYYMYKVRTTEFSMPILSMLDCI